MKYFYIYIIVINIITLLAYGADKLKAKHHRWRTPEKTLWLLGLLGGAPGALIGMKIFRHKTRHISFYIINLCELILWAALYIFVLYPRFGH